ncbi:MAG: hypothetical protein ACK52A_07885 [Planctomycetota bacterium]
MTSINAASGLDFTGLQLTRLAAKKLATIKLTAKKARGTTADAAISPAPHSFWRSARAAVVALLVSLAASTAMAQTQTQTQAQAQEAKSDDPVELRFEDYEAKIQALLKTRLPEEKAFVSAVMAKVRAGEIPEKMVETSFKWVLNKHPETNNPFLYFERVLRIQGNKAEIEIPPFDYDVYRQRLGRRSSNRNS